jgi:16S rRNA (uracil1498-N3)-methyltransferase
VTTPPTPEPAWVAGERAAAHVFVARLTDECVVDGDDGHHLQRVRRLHPGERVTAADGTGAWRVYEIRAAPPGALHLAAISGLRIEPELRPRLSVALALTKGGALDEIVAALTELGVHRVEPVRSARSVVRWDARRAAAAVERLRLVAREAAMQSRRARVPEVAALADLAALAGRPGLVVADAAGDPPSALALARLDDVLVVIGPEGGLAPDELAGLGAPRVAVGHHVLRAHTAPLAVVAALLEHTTPVSRVVN